MIPVADGHTHTNPVRGLGAAAIAERFKAVGGWFMAIVALSPWHYGIEFNGFESYASTVDILLRECKAASEAGISVACLAGFHPADVDRLIDKYRMKPLDVLELGFKVVEYEAKLCSEGQIDGIGEVGRQHYKTFPTRAIISQMILERALELAKDYGCIVHMHLEQEGDTTIGLVDIPAKRIGLPNDVKRKIVFHHSKPGTAVKAYRRGYIATVPGTPHLLMRVLGRVEPVFILESDHIDDPSRPGAVVYPWVMAETIQKLYGKREVGEDYLYRINVDLVEKLYGVKYEY
ncbi:MAG: TatD family hydrolase [Desulfurococcales archaeon]|nr:TatD family hydrolase [Desulfurococcales archaeon]